MRLSFLIHFSIFHLVTSSETVEAANAPLRVVDDKSDFWKRMRREGRELSTKTKNKLKKLGTSAVKQSGRLAGKLSDKAGELKDKGKRQYKKIKDRS